MNKLNKKSKQSHEFHFNARTAFLTYPKATFSKELLLERLREIKPIQDYIIASEAHIDGTPHLHAVIRWESKFHTTDQRAFDVEGFHPHIKTLKTTADFTRTVKYVEKDGDFIGNLIEKVTPRQQLAKALITEGLTPKFIRDHPEIIFTNFNSVKSWLNALRPDVPRPLTEVKLSGIWLYGPSNSGKSTWLWAYLKSLEPELFAEIVENNDFGHVTPRTVVFYADEYRGHLTVQQLNRLSDGHTILNTKGGSVSIGKPVVIIVSNFTMREVYKNVSDDIFRTLENRFRQYDSSINMPRFPTYSIKL